MVMWLKTDFTIIIYDNHFQHYGPVAKVLEYKHKDLCKDAHRLSWKEGDWTDDSDQMILIMRSLVDCNGKVRKYINHMG